MFRSLIETEAPTSPADSASFAVIDLETTGLYANGHDRVVEIAVVRLNARGEHIAEFVTLVNPERDIGPTRIHGIRARDVRDAPLFREIAGDVVGQLAGAVLVGHNARFDNDFLHAEFTRLGHQIPKSPAVCTLVLARKLHQAPCYKLAALCSELEIPHDKGHTALCDARATAMLFADLVRRALQNPTRGRAALAELGCESWTPPSESAWPRLRATGKRCLRPPASEPGESSTEPNYVASLVSRLAPPP